MKQKIHRLMGQCLCALTTLLIFTSCGEDRSGEYYALISSKSWIYDVMQEYYLYYEDLPAEEELDFFLSPQEFLNAAASERDQKDGVLYSHVDSVNTASSRALSEKPTYGYEAAMLQAENGDYALQVLYIQPESPAEEAGLKRGDIIIAADGKAIESDDYTTYVSEPTSACTFTLGTYDFELAQLDSTGTVEMPAPRLVEEHNLLKTVLFSTGNRTAAYILYNSFGEEEDITQWQTLYTQLASAQPDDIIVDLRYNPGGYVTTAQTVGTVLAPADASGQTMLTMTSNDKLNQTQTYLFDPALLSGGTSLSYQDLYIITGPNTASASEAVINSLRPYMSGHLYQVGTPTFGKNVAQALYTSEEHPSLELWLTTFLMANSQGFSDYAEEGLLPDFELSEPYGTPLGELGSEEDLLMQPILIRMMTGAFPTLETYTRSAEIHRPMKLIESSIAHKPKLARISHRPLYVHP